MIFEQFNQRAFGSKENATWLDVAGKTLSYGEQIRRCQKLHAWLRVNDVTSDQPVLVAVKNEFERMSLIVALISIGQPTVIFDPNGTQYETDIILSECDFCAVIAEEQVYQRLSLHNYQLPYLKVVKENKNSGVFGRLLGKKSNAISETGWPHIFDGDTSPETQTSIASATVLPSDLAYVVFTSGTTSRPKGVEVQYSALLAQAMTLKEQYKLSESSRLLNTLPLHHVDGFIQGPIIAWYSGASLFRPCGFSTQNLAYYLNSIYRERITHLIAVPTMLSLIIRLGREWGENFTSPDFEFVVSCAGHLELSLWESFEEVFHTRVVNMYGLTETTTSALFSGPDEDSRRLGTLGKPVNSEIKIVNQNGELLEVGEVGELLISSPQLMKGYHRDPIASSEVLSDGWLASGDLVKQLDSGHIELVGRKKNQIISGGRNVSPEEVAEVINLHGNVVESIVLGQADQDWGESVVALVVCEDEEVSDVELINWCRARLSEYKVPRYLFIVEQLEKGPSGKILIQDAQQELDRRMLLLSELSGEDGTLETRVLAIAASVFRIEQDELSSLSSPENTPGWDSLAHMNFIIGLEKGLGITLSARDIMQIENIELAIEVCGQKVE